MYFDIVDSILKKNSLKIAKILDEAYLAGYKNAIMDLAKDEEMANLVQDVLVIGRLQRKLETNYICEEKRRIG